MQHKRLVAHLDGVAGVVSALIARHDVEVLGQKVNDLAFAFITPLSADDNDYFGHGKEWSANSKQQTANSSDVFRIRLFAVCCLLFTFSYAVAAPATCLSIMREIASLEVAPTTRSSSLPPLKRINVGMPLIP